MNGRITIPSTVRADLLDCIQSNLAALGDQYHGPDTHLALGCVLRFRPAPDRSGWPTVEPPLTRQLREACRWLGLTVRASWRDVPGAGLRLLAERHGQLYVVGDAYSMPWLPYFRQQQMDHSYLVRSLDDRALVTDLYRNQTAWGPAEPGHWELDWECLPSASQVLALRPVDSGPVPVKTIVDLVPPSNFVVAYARHPDRIEALRRLAAETWLLARSRGLHAAFRTRERSDPDAALTEHVERWNDVAAQTFLALRRVQRGRPEPPGLMPMLAGVLAAEPALFVNQPGPAPSPSC